MKKVTVIDYGLSNLLSVERAFAYLGAETVTTSSPKDILEAELLVLPGVGAFGDGMRGLEERGLAEAILIKTATGTPLLGICLGMQMLFTQSEEFGLHKGLGLIEGAVQKIPDTDKDGALLRVPHVGWSAIMPYNETNFENTVLSEIRPLDEMYFVHSFEAKPKYSSDYLACAEYGKRDICAVAVHDNVIGCQFHPEKSGKAGLTILKKFLEL